MEYNLPPQILGKLPDVRNAMTFVRSTGRETVEQQPTCSKALVNDESASKDYEEILATAAKKRKQDDDEIVVVEEIVVDKLKKKKRKKLEPFTVRDVHAFLRAAKDGQLETVKEFVQKGMPLNARDSYGWSGLMCAAAEGHFEVCRHLIESGADVEAVDARGKGVIQIAMDNRQTELVDRLMRFSWTTNDPKPSTSKEKTPCETCRTLVDDMTSHLASITHQLNDEKAKGPAPQSGIMIGPGNIGYRMMAASGWTEDQGLGKDSKGYKFPIKTVLKQDRSGLGKEKLRPKVTHFQPFDKNAVKGYKKPDPQMGKKEVEQKKRKEDRLARNFRASFNFDDEAYELLK